MGEQEVRLGTAGRSGELDREDRLSHATIHDLLGHLATIKGNAQLMRRRMSGDADGQHERLLSCLTPMEQAINELTRRVGDLRPGHGEQDASVEAAGKDRRSGSRGA